MPLAAMLWFALDRATLPRNFEPEEATALCWMRFAPHMQAAKPGRLRPLRESDRVALLQHSM